MTREQMYKFQSNCSLIWRLTNWCTLIARVAAWILSVSKIDWTIRWKTDCFETVCRLITNWQLFSWLIPIVWRCENRLVIIKVRNSYDFPSSRSFPEEGMERHLFYVWRWTGHWQRHGISFGSRILSPASWSPRTVRN